MALINHLIGGLDPAGFHAVNMLLHTAVTVLYMYVCEQVVFSCVHLALLAGLMFAVHPVHTEASFVLKSSEFDIPGTALSQYSQGQCGNHYNLKETGGASRNR
ncbi:RNA processing [Branchiostoma belcheri]|nr:RNA processing [Branchiostoma belcheri]